MGRYQFFVAMDLQSDKEARFDEIYDVEHVPEQVRPYTSNGQQLLREWIAQAAAQIE